SPSRLGILDRPSVGYAGPDDSGPAGGRAESDFTVTRAADVTMASASSAQREPSMEEILASIRRIIEDSDSGRKQPEEAAEALAVESVEVDPGEEDAPVPVVDAFRAELHAVPEESKPVTLADEQE